jgi:hypothetical protein
MLLCSYRRSFGLANGDKQGFVAATAETEAAADVLWEDSPALGKLINLKGNRSKTAVSPAV